MFSYIIANGQVKFLGLLRKIGCIYLEEWLNTMIQQF